jgi:hypothetical protein
MLADSSTDADVIVPVTDWHALPSPPKKASRRLPGGQRALVVELALYDGDTPSESLLAAIGHALRRFARRPRDARGGSQGWRNLDASGT